MTNLRSQIVYWVVLSFFVCVGITQVVDVPILPTLVLGGTVAVLLGIMYAVLRGRVRKLLLLLLLVVCAGLLGVFRAGMLEDDRGEVFSSIFDSEVTIDATVVDDRDMRSDNQKLTVSIDAFTHDGSEYKNISEYVLVTAERFPRYQYGDALVITGTMVEPENFTSGTGREFNYRMYLAKDDIYAQMFYPEISQTAHGDSGFIKSTMLRLKHRMSDSISRVLQQPHAGLLAGELLGEKAALGDKLQNDFRKTGVIHLVVLSGFNVTIVAIFFIWLLSRFLHPRIALVVGIGSIALFALLVGGGATVIRASIMAVLVIIARLVGRPYDVLRGLFIAGAIMVFVNPYIVLYDVSFQLSFLATMSLITIAPFVERGVRWVPEFFSMRETIVATLSAQVLVIPLLLYAVGELSVVSPLVNVLVVPLVPMTMLFGFITALVGLISPVIALIPAAPTHIFLALQLWFVDIFAGLPWASITVPPIPVWMVLTFYSCVFAWVIIKASQKESEELAKYVSGSSMDSKIEKM